MKARQSSHVARSGSIAILAVAAALCPAALPAQPVSFDSGSLIIPMDVAADGQDTAMLRAYGLVYRLLGAGVPVHWAIAPSKIAGGADFTIDSSTSVVDLRTGAPIALPRSYRGGPFVIDGASAAGALPIVAAWQATLNDSTAVHQLTSGAFSAAIARRLTRAPSLAVFGDGNEAIHFNNLNAAGIPDSQGNSWTEASPDRLTEAAILGATAAPGDGALFEAGHARYCFVAAAHYGATANSAAVVEEVRGWLDRGRTHLFAQCESIDTFENTTGGFLLTSAGVDDDGNPPAPMALQAPAHPLAQMDSAFQGDVGTIDSLGILAGSIAHTGVATLINQQGATLRSRISLLHGRLDGDAAKGQVTYLAGHDYSTALPITSNPQTNGIRIFLNALLASDCSSPSGACPATPDACAAAGKSTLAVKRAAAPAKSKLSWKWSKGEVAASQASFGDPVAGSSNYVLCVYDQDVDVPSLKLQLDLAGGGACGSKPCWKAVRERGWSFRDKSGSQQGLIKLNFKGGIAGKPSLTVAAKGANLPLPEPALPGRYFDQDAAVTIQLHDTTLDRCWSSSFDTTDTKKNDGVQFKAVAR
ncbi:MAG TPA: hypothetical protein VEB21_17750 [Terriglobales bacterium]|nr:hypothetical protein [Terriglobales bacterium]